MRVVLFTLLVAGCWRSKPPPAPPTPAVTDAALYSCFAFAMKASTGEAQRKSACMRTDECEDYRTQVTSVGGVSEVGACGTVAALWCFHHAATESVPDGADVCQPTLEDCRKMQAEVGAAGTPIDRECAQR